MRVCVCVRARARTTGLRGTQYGDVSTQGVAHASACTCMCECARMCACVYARAHARWLKTCSQRALNIRAISLSHRPSLSLSLTPPPSLPLSLSLSIRRLVLVDVGDVAALACEIASAVRLVRQEGTAGKGRLLPQRQISSFSSSLSGNSRMPASVSREEEEEGTRERDSLVVADCVRRLWDSERMCRDELAFYRKVLAQ